MEFVSITAARGGAEDSERARGGGGGGVAWVEREHMFEKVVTPSDVGKLNRLVIPKQYAERYFPALGTAAAATEGSKGLVLSFEDRAGKAWRFRYSYWNSSQSYVMTKGWSRFVKEKRLGAGDTVAFARGAGDAAARARFFIDFRRRRQDVAFLQPPALASAQRLPLPSVPICSPWQDYSAYAATASAPNRHVLFLRPQMPAAVVLTSVPVRVAASAVEATRSKRIRLFGVNLDTPPVMEDGEDDSRVVTRTASTLLQLPSPSSSTSSSTVGKDMCSLDLGL